MRLLFRQACWCQHSRSSQTGHYAGEDGDLINTVDDTPNRRAHSAEALYQPHVGHRMPIAEAQKEVARKYRNEQYWFERIAAAGRRGIVVR